MAKLKGQGSGFRVLGSGFRDTDFGLRFRGLGCDDVGQLGR